MSLTFAKYCGSGNDFVIFDCRQGNTPISPAFVRKICHRQLGVGADGVLLLENSTKGDFRMRIFNADGSLAEMCGNGLRCLVLFLYDLGLKCEEVMIETEKRLLKASHQAGKVTVEMGSPEEVCWHRTIKVGGRERVAHSLDTGVPHLVLFEEAGDKELFLELGRTLRFDPSFAPRGTNVNLLSPLDAQTIAVRTYERGVEAETLACGTGVTACALAAGHLLKMASPVRVIPPSGETLTVSWTEEQGQFTQVKMEGNAHRIFTGTVAPSLMLGI